MILGKPCSAVVFLWAALLLGACGGDGGSSGGPDAPGDPDASPPLDSTPTAPVNGMAIDTFLTAQGPVKVPRDLSMAMIAALVPAADGSFTTLPGTGTAQGTFTIPDVPEGPYYLSLNGRFIVTSLRTLDISTTFFGRAMQKKAAAPTMLTLNVTNMNAWQDGDILEMYIPNAGAAFSNPEAFAPTPPTVGATTLDLTVDYQSAELPNVIDPTMGDAAFITHGITATTAQGVPYQALGAISYLQPFALANGSTVTATGAFAAVAQTKTRNVDWRSTEFANLISTAVPGGTTTFTNTFLDFVELDEAAFYSTPVLFQLKAPTTPDVLTTVTYGNPFSATWKEQLRASISGFKRFTLGTKTGNSFAQFSISGSADELLAGPIRPTIGPVQNLRVAEQDGSGPLAGLPAHPKITWNPPTMGQANSYSVQVFRFVADATRLNRVQVGRINTKETSAILPDGILKAGEPHFIIVRAFSHPGTTYDRFPFVISHPLATADRVTTVFTP